MITRKVRHGLLALLLGISSATVGASDWPQWRKDPARSAKTSESIKLPLAPVWIYKPHQAPRPAWREDPYCDFDYAHKVVAAGGMVYFGSTADDTLRALDAATGALKWRFTTGGPIRFSPVIHKGRVYVVSDDGYLYCLNAKTGGQHWRLRGGPSGEMLLGNGRMISNWPCRSGVLIDDDILYFTAGIWPTEGVFIYALDAESGREIWCNDTSGHINNKLHVVGGGSIGRGVAPQGYLAASKDLLLVPTGRLVPAAFRKSDGRLLYYRTGRGSGGSWCIIDEARQTFQNFSPGIGAGAFYYMDMKGYDRNRAEFVLNSGKLIGRTKLFLPARFRVDADEVILTGR